MRPGPADGAQVRVRVTVGVDGPGPLAAVTLLKEQAGAALPAVRGVRGARVLVSYTARASQQASASTGPRSAGRRLSPAGCWLVHSELDAAARSLVPVLLARAGACSCPASPGC